VSVSVCLSDCWSVVTTVSCAKTAEPIAVPFSMWICGGSGNCALREGPGEWGSFGGHLSVKYRISGVSQCYTVGGTGSSCQYRSSLFVAAIEDANFMIFEISQNWRLLTNFKKMLMSF